jgi:hypothetical protein
LTGSAPGQSFTRDQALDWFRNEYPRVKEGTITAHLTRLSTNNKNRLHYKARSDDDVLFQVDGAHFRSYDPARDPSPIHEDSQVATEPAAAHDADGAGGTESAFAYEHDLRDYLARNLQLIEPGLRLYEQDGITGVEYPAGGRYIDILAVDANGGYVVIELKVSKGYDRTVGQLLRYMGWIERHHADPGENVRGVVVAKDISEDLRLACAHLQDVQLFEYALSVSLQPVVL